MPDCRFLRIEHVNITPAFFKKLVQASKSSRLTCVVQLWLNCLPFDVSNLDIGVPPSRILVEEEEPPNTEYHYDADHGNGIRLEIHFTSYTGVTWNVTVRHGKKDCEDFGPEPDEEQNERAAS
ncbi:hypothetical protein AAVH_43764 [Aphelenchoides avenae]|nr:hypothetical protein AAVH_43764 [Aphelenchus avenae]